MNFFQMQAKKIVIVAVLAASFSAIFVRLIDAPVMAIGFYRLGFSLPFFAIIVLGWHRKELLEVSPKDLAICILSGVFLALHFFTWFSSLSYTTVASAMILFSTHPIIILLITTLLLKEKTNKKAVIGVLFALVGAAIISGGDYSFSGKAIIGDVLALLGALFMALYFLTGRKMRKKLNAAVYIFLVFTACWLTFGIGMLATRTPFGPYSTSDFAYFIALALVCQIGAHAVFNWSLAYVTPLYLSTSEMGEAIAATILAVVIFSEIPTAWQLIGGMVTICGLIYYNFHDAQTQKIDQEP
jgi:drug/metabolite transporter (DMT)-like permease